MVIGMNFTREDMKLFKQIVGWILLLSIIPLVFGFIDISEHLFWIGFLIGIIVEMVIGIGICILKLAFYLIESE